MEATQPTKRRISKNVRRPNAVQAGLIPPAPHPLNPERMEGEGFEEYRYRRAFTNYILKQRRKGLYWNGNKQTEEEG